MKFRNLLGLTLSVALIAACESKRVEQNPNEVAGAKTTLAETKTYSTKVNGELGKLKTLVRKVGAIVKVIEMSVNPEMSKNKTYTVTDMFIDILDESEKGISLLNDEKFTRKSKIEIEGLNKGNPCRSVEILVEGSKDKEGEVGEVNLAVKTCATDGEFQTLAATKYNENKELVTTYDLSPLQALAHDAVKDLLSADLKCEIYTKDKNTLQALQCTNIRILISKDDAGRDFEYAVVNSLAYSSTNEVAYAANGGIYERSVKKATFKVYLDKNGKPVQEPTIVRIEPTK